MIDAPAEVQKFIPEELYEDCEIMTQQSYYSGDTAIEKIWEDVRKQYKKYADEAKLVITSRLHVVSPCMAMGIPVIFVKNQIDARFGWIDRYIPLYDRMSYDQIDWHPEPIEYEEVKRVIIRNATEKIMEIYRKYTDSYEVNQLYENTERRKLITFQETIFGNFEKAYTFLRNNFEKTETFTYSIWGANRASENFYKFMQTEYPNSKLKDVMDLYKEGKFLGTELIKPEKFERKENEVIFVLPVKASNMADKLFREKGIDRKNYVCCGDKFIESLREPEKC